MISLCAEERCGHLVSEEAKKLWAAQLDILKEIQRICKKHGITYYAIEGTLLGAVRHKGFIPWDDDIDIGMPTADYEKFAKVVQSELPDYYRFQHFSTQDGMNIGIARVRDIRATSCTEFEYNTFTFSPEYNCGIFVDIFPMTDAAPNKLCKKLQDVLGTYHSGATAGYVALCKKKIRADYTPNDWEKKCIGRWKILSRFSGYKGIAAFSWKVLKMFRRSKKFGLIGFYGNADKFIWDKSLFEETVELPFEDTTISCPAGYHKLLTQRYGDYNVFVKGTAVHTFCVLDPDTPYKEKFKERYAQFEK